MRQSQFDARSIFEHAEDMLVSQGIIPNSGAVRLTQSYIRTEIPMALANTNFNVPLIVSNNSNSAVRASERRLNLQDVLVCSELFIGVMLATSATGTNSKLYTYENPLAFSGSNESSSILQLYNGYFQLLNNGTNIFPAWDIQRNYKVQRTQQTTATYYSGGTATTTLDSLDGSDDGFVPIEPNLIINGGGNMQGTIVLPAAMAAIHANSYFVVIMRGILAQNVTSVK